MGSRSLRRFGPSSTLPRFSIGGGWSGCCTRRKCGGCGTGCFCRCCWSGIRGGGDAEPAGLLGSPEPVGITRNDFEEAFLGLVDRYGLPRPRMNADLAVRGRFFEIDALWEEQRLVLELDSHGVHGTKKRFESDRQRDRILIAEGYRTMHITWRQLQEEPEAIVADLESALG